MPESVGIGPEVVVAFVGLEVETVDAFLVEFCGILLLVRPSSL